MVVNFSNIIRFLNIHFPWLLFVVLITIQSHIGNNNLDSTFLYADKITHLIVYGTLAWLLARGIFKGRNTFLQRNYFWIVLIILGFFGIIDEIHQYFIPGRYFDLKDWMADMSGGIFFLIIFRFRNKTTLEDLKGSH